VYIINLFFVKRLPKYFFRWRVLAKEQNPKVYTKMLRKHLILSQLTTKKDNHYKNMAKRYLYFWKMQCKHKLPVYSKNDVGKRFLNTILTESLKREKRRPSATQVKFKSTLASPDKDKKDISIPKEKTYPKYYSVLTIAVRLETIFCDILESRLIYMKVFVMERLKCLLQLERSVMESNQMLLIRSLRIQETAYFNYFDAVKKDRIRPEELKVILEGKDARKNKQLEIDMKNQHGVMTYAHAYMLQKKMSMVNKKKSAADLLLAGVWSDSLPYLRFRDYLVSKVINLNIHLQLKNVLEILRNYKDRINMKMQLKKQFCRENKEFKNIWGKMYIKMIVLDRVYIINDMFYQVLELNRRIYNMNFEIANFKKLPIVMESERQKKTLVEGRLIQKQVKEALARKYALIKAEFPGGFLSILLDTTLPKEAVREKLSLFVLKTLSKLFAEGFEQIEQKKPEELAMEREKERLKREQEQREKELVEERLREAEKRAAAEREQQRIDEESMKMASKTLRRTNTKAL